MGYDLKIIGGTIVDGTGAPGRRGDVGVRDGRIVALGDAPDAATRTIAADGLVVAPGFVDIHTHYDAQILWDPMMTISPWHGVTSVVLGNCGFGVAPTRPEHRGLILRTLERVEGMSLAALEAGLGLDWPFVSFPDYLDVLERRGMAINAAVMVGHTPVRLYVMGEDATERAATPDEIARMHDIVLTALRAGAVGFATSVSRVHVGYAGKPVPSRLAEFDEMRAMARALRDAGTGVFHYNVAREFPFDRFATVARDSGRPVVWTALLSGQLGPGRHRELLAKSAELIAEGLPIYPQVACRPIVSEFNFRQPVPFDTWALFKPVREAPSDEVRRALYADADFRGRFRDEVAGRGGNDGYFTGGALEGEMRRRMWRLTEISFLPQEPALQARRLEDVAAERGVHPCDLILDLALASDLQARFRMPLVNVDEDEIAELLRDPNTVLGLGDGGAHMSQLCDACYSTHLLGHWVRERGDLTLEQAVHLLTLKNARLFGISNRGRLATGLPADIVVFDPATVGAGPLERVHDLPAGEDRLISRPSGMHAVIVNGTLLPPPGESLPRGAALPGHLLRHGKAAA